MTQEEMFTKTATLIARMSEGHCIIYRNKKPKTYYELRWEILITDSIITKEGNKYLLWRNGATFTDDNISFDTKIAAIAAMRMINS